MDNKENDILTRIFRDRLTGYKHPVEKNDAVWDSIERSLPKPKTTSRLVWLKVAIAAAAVFAGVLCLNLFLTHKGKDDVIIETITPGIISGNQPNPSNPVYIDSTQNQEIKKGNTDVVKIAENHSYITSDKKEIKQISDVPFNELKAIPVKKDKEETTIAEVKPEPKEKEISKEQDNFINESSESETKTLYAYSNSIKNKKNKNLSLALAMGNSTGHSSESVINNHVVNLLVGSDNYLNIKPSATPPHATNGDISEQTKYNIPVSFGFSVRKYFPDSWALESGLVYSYLSSTETTGLRSVIQKKETELHYIGIPLKVVYTFYSNNRLSLYANAGGMGEYCVYGKETIENSSVHIDVPEIQWSVLGSLGLNYKLVDHLGLFVEPGVSYYFDDGSEVNSIRKAVPFNLNLQAGLRLTY